MTGLPVEVKHTVSTATRVTIVAADAAAAEHVAAALQQVVDDEEQTPRQIQKKDRRRGEQGRILREEPSQEQAIEIQTTTYKMVGDSNHPIFNLWPHLQSPYYNEESIRIISISKKMVGCAETGIALA